MKDQLVSFEVATIAKEKGFDWDVKEAYYATKNELSDLMREECWNGYPVNTEDKAYLAAPTQSLLQRWLREVHKVHIEVFWDSVINKYCYVTQIENIENNWRDPDHSSNTYEEALESGLKEALKLI
jgi:hypothetical protein